VIGANDITTSRILKIGFCETCRRLNQEVEVEELSLCREKEYSSEKEDFQTVNDRQWLHRPVRTGERKRKDVGNKGL